TACGACLLFFKRLRALRPPGSRHAPRAVGATVVDGRHAERACDCSTGRAPAPRRGSTPAPESRRSIHRRRPRLARGLALPLSRPRSSLGALRCVVSLAASSWIFSQNWAIGPGGLPGAPLPPLLPRPPPPGGFLPPPGGFLSSPGWPGPIATCETLGRS